MIVQLVHNEITYETDLSKPISLAIALQDGTHNPSCYYAESPSFETIRQGDFVGDVRQGGSVNYQRVYITPHGNGTHTECVGHITPDRETLDQVVQQFHFVAEVLTLSPRLIDGDQVLHFDDYIARRRFHTEAVIIRRSDNNKPIRDYNDTNPPYLDPKITAHMAQNNVTHLVVDLPSVDKEKDGGALRSHRNFWQPDTSKRLYATITELACIPNEVADGLYLLGLYLPLVEIDAFPSQPVVYKLVPSGINSD